MIFIYYIHDYTSMARTLTLYVEGTKQIVIESLNEWLWRFLWMYQEIHYSTQFSVAPCSPTSFSLLRDSSFYYSGQSLPFTFTTTKYRLLSVSKVSKHIKSHSISNSGNTLLWESWEMLQKSNVRWESLQRLKSLYL